MRRLVVSCVSATLVAFFGVSSAGADPLKGNGKTYSALACTESPNGVIIPNDQFPYGENDVRYNSLGWAYNSSLEHRIVVSCPIVREYVDNPMKRAWVTVLNETDEDVTCEIEAFTDQGVFLEQSSPFVFKPNFTGFPQTGFKSNDPKDDDGGPFDNSFEFVPSLSNPRGYYILQCFLPPMDQLTIGADIDAAYIVRYLIEEVSN